jgi:hypothetical protein
LVGRAELVASEALAEGIVLRNFRRMEGAVATGNIIPNIAAALPTATGLLPIVLAGPRAAIHSPTVEIARANNLVVRAAIWAATAQEAGLA